MSLVLAFDAWPEADQRLWTDLTRVGGPLDDRGALAHLRETSRKSLIICYGRWLAWVATQDPAALDLPPADRATMERLRLWLDDLSHTRPMTRLSFVEGALRLLRKAHPDRDWRPHLRLQVALKRKAGRGDASRKQGRVLDSSVLLDGGVRHATHNADAATTELQGWRCRRDGTMVALLALVPIRRRTFVRLELGSSLLVMEDRIAISVAGDLMKNGRPFHCDVPEAVAPLLRRYIEDVRPWFMTRGKLRHNLLWVDDRGAPFDDNYFGAKIAKLTTRMTGVRVSPHLFRDAAATTLSRTSPQAARLIRPVLAHTSSGTAERHYIQAGSLEAGRNFADLVRRLKRNAP